jgi:hypothetical protein
MRPSNDVLIRHQWVAGGQDMTGCLNGISVNGHATGFDGDSPRRLQRKPILPMIASGMTKKRLPMAGMILGYLGLVAILSMAPYWHLASTPYQSQVLACTDFGGSR